MKKNLLFSGMLMALMLPAALLTTAFAETGIAAQAETIVLGETFTDSISGAGEVKDYYFTTTSNDSYYSMTTKNISMNGYGFYTNVYDSYDNLIWNSSNLYANNSSYTSLKLEPNETYRVECYATNKLTGNFSFLVEETVDDWPNSKGEAKAVSIGETAEYTLDGWNDVEWFKFTTSDVYAYYEISSKNVSIPGYGYYFELYDYEEALILSHNNLQENRSEVSYYKLDPGTTYYVKCYATNKLTGNYSFSVKEISDDTYDEKENSSSINLNTLYTRNLETKSDVDFFKFKTKAGQDYTFSFKNIGSGSYGQYAYIYSETNEQMAAIENIPGGKSGTATATLKANTTYYVKVYNTNSSIGYYRFSISDGTTSSMAENDDMSPIHCDISNVVDPIVAKNKVIGESMVYGGGSMEEAAEIKLDHTSYGEIEGREIPYWYAFTTTGNDSYYDITAKNVSIYDYGWYTELYDGNMNKIWSASNIYGNNSQWTQIKLEPNTTYYFKCYTKSTKEIGRYSITIKEIIDDLDDTKETAKEIAYGERVVHCINSINDQDWFTFTTTSEDCFYKIYSKNLSMNHNGDSYGYYCIVYLGEEEIVSHNNLSKNNGYITYTKLEPNTTYTIKCYGTNKIRGNYEISVDTIADDTPDTQANATELKINKIYDRKLNAMGDVDYYSFTVEESGTYTFYTKSLSVDSYGLYTVLTDSYGEKLAECNNLRMHQAESRQVTLTAGKVYYVKSYATNKYTGDYRIYLANSTPKDEFITNPFVDVHEEDYYYNPVLWATEENITAGVTPSVFGPLLDCTRSQVVTFLWRTMGRPEPTITTSSFKDVSPNAYYYKAVLWAVENKVTSGYNTETFGTEDLITRAQFVSFLWRLMGRPEAEEQGTSFVDVFENEYYYKAVMWAVENGITAGYYQNYFAPGVSCTRGQVVSFLYRSQKIQ